MLTRISARHDTKKKGCTDGNLRRGRVCEAFERVLHRLDECFQRVLFLHRPTCRHDACTQRQHTRKVVVSLCPRNAVRNIHGAKLIALTAATLALYFWRSLLDIALATCQKQSRTSELAGESAPSRGCIAFAIVSTLCVQTFEPKMFSEETDGIFRGFWWQRRSITTHLARPQVPAGTRFVAEWCSLVVVAFRMRQPRR